MYSGEKKDLEECHPLYLEYQEDNLNTIYCIKENNLIATYVYIYQEDNLNVIYCPSLYTEYH